MSVGTKTRVCLCVCGHVCMFASVIVGGFELSTLQLVAVSLVNESLCRVKQTFLGLMVGQVGLRISVAEHAD